MKLDAIKAAITTSLEKGGDLYIVSTVGNTFRIVVIELVDRNRQSLITLGNTKTKVYTTSIIPSWLLINAWANAKQAFPDANIYVENYSFGIFRGLYSDDLANALLYQANETDTIVHLEMESYINTVKLVKSRILRTPQDLLEARRVTLISKGIQRVLNAFIEFLRDTREGNNSDNFDRIIFEIIELLSQYRGMNIHHDDLIKILMSIGLAQHPGFYLLIRSDTQIIDNTNDIGDLYLLFDSIVYFMLHGKLPGN